MAAEEKDKKTQTNKGYIYPPSKCSDKSPSLETLIELEWLIIQRLWEEAQQAKYEKHKAQLFNALSGHIRNLAKLLKMAGKTKEQKDLAKLLEELAKDMKDIRREMKRAIKHLSPSSH